MALSSTPTGLVLLLLLTGAQALQTTLGSSCSSVCGNTLSTNSSDIICNDYDYYSSVTGSTFMDCLACLQTSNTTSDSGNDVSWYLYNLRYASAVCLYDFPAHNDTNVTSSCDVEYACAPLQGALEYGNLNPSNETEFGYCQADGNAFYGVGIDNCVSCLQSSPSTYTANFLLALKAGCQQEPAPGSLLSISGSIFSTAAINITVPSNSSGDDDSSSSKNTSVLSLTAIIGIAVGLGCLFLLAAGLFALYCVRQRRHAREAATDHYPYPSHRQQYYYGKEDGHRGSLSTGQSYPLPQYTIDYISPKNTFGESPEPDQGSPGANNNENSNNNNNNPSSTNDFASNAEYYDRLEGRARGRPLQAHPVRLGTTTATPTANTNAALPTHPAYIPRTLATGHLGGRASRSASTRSSARSVTLGRESSTEPLQQRAAASGSGGGRYHQQQRSASAMDEERVPSRAGSLATARSIRVELGGPPSGGSEQPQGLSVPPPVVSWRSRRASVSPSPQPQLQPRSPPSPPPPPPPPDRGQTATPAMASLILPGVPRIRVPGKKPPKLKISGPMAADQNGGGSGGGGHFGISGPLAFPDSRFSVRPPNDRIVEQTVDRSGHIVEVPIGSGKSYLYG